MSPAEELRAAGPDPYYVDDSVTLYLGDCREVLAGVADASIDAVVCDPPYELEFMGRDWDASGVAFDPATWRECLRLLKPGGHLVAFGGARTYHRMTVAIEDAGFEIRDSMHWIYGTGFPKSHDVSKAIDKAAGVEREVVGVAADFARDGAARKADGSHVVPHEVQGGHGYADRWAAPVTTASTNEAKQWEGWGTAIKPAHEPIVLARKPFPGTVAANVLEYGTGALNIAACRVAVTAEDAKAMERANTPGSARMKAGASPIGTFTRSGSSGALDTTQGRWPTNVVFTHSAVCVEDGPCASDCPVGDLDRQSGHSVSVANKGARRSAPVSVDFRMKGDPGDGYADAGGASRFFPAFRYEAKAPSGERPKLADGTAHSTVKPLTLMRWLVGLVTPPGGTVLDPFAGSGTTGEACVIEGFRCVMAEREQPHAELIKARLSKPLQPSLFGEVVA